MKENRTVIIVVVIIVLVVGCVLVFVIGRPSPKEPEVISVPTNTAVKNTVAAAEKVPTNTPLPATATTEPAPVVPTPWEGYVATDPESVVLASGELQFVQTFAFF